MKLPVIGPITLLVLRIASFLLYLLTILSAFGGRVNPEITTLPSMMVLVSGWLAILTAVVAVAWLIGRKFITGGLGIATLIICWSTLSDVTPLNLPKSADPGARTFTLMSWNVIHGWDQQPAKAKENSNRAIEYILAKDADIVCLQEMVSFNNKEIPGFTDALKDSVDSKYPFRAGTAASDMKVLSKYPVEEIPFNSLVPEHLSRLPFTFYKVRIKGISLTLVAVHLLSPALNDEERKVITQAKSLESAKKSLDEMKNGIYAKMGKGFKTRKLHAELLHDALEKIEGPVVVAGDFNDVPGSYAYRLIKGDDLRDAYSDTGFGPLSTYNQHLFYFHIDQILYRGPLKAISVSKGNIKCSDHYPLTATFQIE